MHIRYTPTKCWTSLVGSHHEDLRQDDLSCFHMQACPLWCLKEAPYQSCSL